jgi:hypothetical protein
MVSHLFAQARELHPLGAGQPLSLSAVDVSLDDPATDDALG